MTKHRKRWLSGAGLVVGLLACLFLISRDKTKPQQADQIDSLVIYSPNSASLLATIIPAFEQTYHIKVELVQDATGKLFSQLQNNEAGKHADIMFGGSSLWYESHPDLFVPYQSPQSQAIDPIYLSPKHTYTPYSIEGSVLLVNKQLSQGLQIHSYDDLLQDNLTGKIGIADPQLASAAFSQLVNILLAKGGYQDPQAWAYLEQLFTDQAPKIYPETSEVNQALKQGRLAVGLTTEAVAYQLIAEGAPLNMVYPDEGTLYLSSAAAIVKGTDKEELAQKFIDYLLSPAVQKSLATSLYQRPILSQYNDASHLKDMSEIYHLNDEAEDILSYQDDIRQRFSRMMEKHSN
ncbi:hypothetical protein AWM75_08350 [Aerococcus urinaehominis]|uniref:Uncharacterized protein n=1 Tax=Aerococcus urinaehominis TaxID=128944 RepID=A0A0X8FMH3_9LACT|nr:extracellular solute-binding protein [Aerococcus urinaehominis]AMB99980.1 hypothetical protein AWM75_08350 [Aerococcus urinaehominis]SDM45531.1 iron(III) transport system substrate-binding protein [Aerococcus urinaehominis]